MIDFEISLLALADGIRIGGSDDEKGYGGFSPRIKLNDVNASFHRWVKSSPPRKRSMPVPGSTSSTKSSGLAMISHSQNPGTRGQWILRRQRSMQNPVFPGRQPVALAKEKPTLLRYRLVIHDGRLSADKISLLQREFSQSSD